MARRWVRGVRGVRGEGGRKERLYMSVVARRLLSHPWSIEEVQQLGKDTESGPYLLSTLTDLDVQSGLAFQPSASVCTGQTGCSWWASRPTCTLPPRDAV